jgi:hypothetical protein
MREGLKTRADLSFELGVELGVPPEVILKAFKALKGQIVSTEGPNLGMGRTPRLYGPDAVAEIRLWVEDWKEGRRLPPVSAFRTRLDALEDSALRLESLLQVAAKRAQDVRAACRALRELAPIASSMTYIGKGLAIVHRPLPVLLSPIKDGWMAELVDAPLSAEGSNPRAAVAALRRSIAGTYWRLSAEQPEESELWTALQALIRRRGKPRRND